MRKVLVCLAVLVLFYAGARVAVGQTVQGVITGTVFDASGAAIPNATVTITNEGTAISQRRPGPMAFTGSPSSPPAITPSLSSPPDLQRMSPKDSPWKPA